MRSYPKPGSSYPNGGRRLARGAVAGLLALCAAGAGPGRLPAAGPGKPRVDALGDPLPPGAVARLGTTRLRALHGSALSPDGKTLASPDTDRAVSLWQLPTGRPVRRFLHRGDVGRVAFSPDGKVLACTESPFGRGNAICLWEVATGKLLRRLPGSANAITTLAFAPDSRTLASGGTDQCIRLWAVATGKQLRSLEGHTEAVRAVAFSPDGKTLASGGSRDGAALELVSVRLWRVATGEAVHTLGWPDPAVEALVFSPDGKALAASGSSQLRVWEAATGKLLLQQPGHSWGLAFAPDGKALAVQGVNCTARLLDPATGETLRQFPGPWSYPATLAFTPDGKVLAALGLGRVRLWRVATGEPIPVPLPGHTGAVSALTWSPDGHTLASGSAYASDDRVVLLWDAATGRQRRRLPLPPWDRGPQCNVEALAFAPDGRAVAAVANGESLVRRWSVATGKELPALKAEEDYAGFDRVAFSPDGRTVTAADRYRVTRWRADTGRLLGTTDVREAEGGAWVIIVSLAFAPEGRPLALGCLIPDRHGPRRGAPGELYVWDAATGRRRHRLRVDTGGRPWAPVLRMAGEEVVWLNEVGSEVGAWDLASGRAARPFRGPEHIPSWRRALALSPDGALLAIEGPGNALGVWEVCTGQRVRRFEGHRYHLTAVAWSPDGKAVATGCQDSTGLVWDLRPGAQDPGGRRGPAPADLGRLWADLAGADARSAYDAGWYLADQGARAVRFLKERLRPAPAVDAAGVRRLVARLDDRRFAVRAAATKELEQLDDPTLQALWQAVKGHPSLEVRRRVQARYEAARQRLLTPEQLRTLRAIQVLERVGSPEARQVLQTLAKGAPAARPTRDARAALKRLGSLR